MKARWKWTLGGVGAIVVFVGARVVSHVEAGRTLRAYADTHGPDVDAQRAARHTARLPARHGAPSTVRCADAQSALLHESVSPPDFAVVLDAWPTSRVSDDARGWVHARAERLDDLRATLTCSLPLDEISEVGTTRLVRWTAAIRDVIVDGLVHAEDGDVAGAIERELDAIRLGEQGSAAIASVMIADAALALARVIASTPSAASLEQTDRELDALAPFVPASTAMLEEMKQLLVDVARAPDSDPDPVGKLDAPRYEPIKSMQAAKMRAEALLLPPRAIVAGAITDLDAQLDRAIDALRSGSAARARDVEAALEAENAKTANPIVWLSAVPAAIAFGRRSVRAACALAVARATLAVERTRDASGQYGAPAMPDDPCAHGSPLHWERLANGEGYRVWSVGVDGNDDGGRHALSPGENHADDLEARRSAVAN